MSKKKHEEYRDIHTTDLGANVHRDERDERHEGMVTDISDITMDYVQWQQCPDTVADTTDLKISVTIGRIF